MSELDDRIANGLRDLVDGAPIDAAVWPETERHIARRSRRRRIGAVGAAVTVAAVVLTIATGQSTGSDHLKVAAPTPTEPVTASSTPQPSTVPPPESTIPEPTTTTTEPAHYADVPDCPSQCVGRTTADVDGDGRPDQIGLYADPPVPSDPVAPTDSKLVVRVLLADGRESEYEDTASWHNSLIGALDVNHDAKAEIFYFNFAGANNRMGHILGWDGSRLVAVQDSDGKPFTTFTAGYAMGGDGFRCAGDTFVVTTLHFDGPPRGWNGFATTYRWDGLRLVKVSDFQPIAIADHLVGLNGEFKVPQDYEQLIGVHCPPIADTYAPG